MNLDLSPTKAQLQKLIAECDDRASHHILWVSKTGDVHISRVSSTDHSATFEQEHPELQLRYETFRKGNEYVGVPAAQDEEWISQLFSSLVEKWAEAKERKYPEYVEVTN